MSGATGAAGGNAAGRKGPGPSAPQGGIAGGQPTGHDASATAVRPTVVGGGTAAARRRSAGPQPAPTAQAQAQPSAPAAGPTERSGYSTPTTYQKGQPTPPGGTRLPSGPGGQPGPSSQPGPGQRPAPAGPSGRTRRARLRVTRTDPWSVMKISFLLSIALGVVTIVGVSLLWMLLDTAGVFSSVGGTLKQATGSDNSSGFNLQSYLSFGNVLMTTALIAVIDVVLLTALATLGAFIYNMAAGITGGVELTLSEED